MLNRKVELQNKKLPLIKQGKNKPAPVGNEITAQLVGEVIASDRVIEVFKLLNLDIRFA